MNENKRRVTLQFIIIGLSLGAVLLLAGGLPNLRFQPGEDLHIYEWIMANLNSDKSAEYPEIGEGPVGSNFWSRLSDGTQEFIVIAFWLILIFSILYAIISPQFRRELVRMFVMLLFFALLIPYIAKRMVHEPVPNEVEMQPGDIDFGDVNFPQPPPFIQQPPEWFLILAKALILVLILGGIYLIWRRLHPKPDPQAVVVKHIKQALSNLESGSEFKDVVIACYAKMCRELQRTQGIGRHKAMTPREFENYLTNSGITSANIRQLTLLFEGVRYGARPTDKNTEHKAKQSLQAILQAYGE
jgi:hypothetical protein